MTIKNVIISTLYSIYFPSRQCNISRANNDDITNHLIPHDDKDFQNISQQKQ